jgi:putative transposase
VYGVRQLAAAFKYFRPIPHAAVIYNMKSSWHHAPDHIFIPETLYMVTAGTVRKAHFFRGDERLEFLQNTLLDLLEKHSWLINAWAVFVNHYHFIARSSENASPLSTIIKQLHSLTSREVNLRDNTYGRKVWFQYWDTCLTYEKSWLARLNYVNTNPVHHGLVRAATQYRFCSASWFQLKVNSSFRRKVGSFRYDRLKVIDEF